MKETVYTLNGLAIDAVLLEKNFNMTKHFYAQGRIMLTDDNNHEIRSVDIINIMRALPVGDIKATWRDIQFSEC